MIVRVGRGAVGAWPDMVERTPILASGADGAAPICSPAGDAHGCVGVGDSTSGLRRCTGGGEGGDGDGGGEGGGKVDGGGSTPDRDGGSDEAKAIASSALRSASDSDGDGGGEGGGKVDGGGSTPDRDGGSDEAKAIASSALRSASDVFSKIRRPAQTAPSNFITVQVKRP